MPDKSINFNILNAYNQVNDKVRSKKVTEDDDLEEIISFSEKYQDENISINTDKSIDNLVQINTSIDNNSSSFIQNGLQNLFSTNENSDEDTNNLILKEIETTLQQRLNEVKAESDSKTGLGWAWNKIKGIFGKGTKGEENDIKKLQELYEQTLENPTKSNLSNLYKQVYGEDLNYDEIQASYQTSLNIQNGEYKTADGNVITLQDVGAALAEQVNGLSESFDETVNSQGILSKGFSWLNNNLLGIGQTENMTTAQIKELKELADKLTKTSDPVEFAGIYKQLTGEELTEDSLSQVFSGTSMVENGKAAEAMMDYETTQKVAITTISAVATGIATATMGPLGGAAAGAVINVGIHGFDAATRTNGEGVLNNLTDYAANNLIKDAAVGAINGFSNVVGNKAGSFIKGFVKEGSGKLAQTGIRLASEFIEGGSDGAISNAGEYMIDVFAGDAEFSADELLKRTSLGFTMGGVMSVGMQEGMSLLGGSAALIKGKNADSVAKGAADSIEEGIEKSTVDGIQDAAEKSVAESVEETLEKSTVDGIQETAEKTITESFEEGLEKSTVDGFQDAAEITAADGVEEVLEKSTVDGIQDTAEKSAVDSIEDGLEKSNIGGFQDAAEITAADSVEEGLEKSTVDGFQDAAEITAADSVEEGLEKSTVDGFQDAAEITAADGVEDGLEKSNVGGFQDAAEITAADGVEDGLEKGTTNNSEVPEIDTTQGKVEVDTEYKKAVDAKIAELSQGSSEIKTFKTANGEQNFRVFYGTQAGSNPAYYVQNLETGELFYAKFPQKTSVGSFGYTQTQTEILSSKLYDLAGIKAPELSTVTNADGVQGLLSKYVPNMSNITSPSSQLTEGFAVDAWLANWDAVVTGNAMTNGTDIFRIDVGGTLDFRAQGGSKNFGNIVDEITTLVDPNYNYAGNYLFSCMTKDDLIASLHKVVDLDDEAVTAIIKSQGMEGYTDILLKRKAYLSDFLSNLETDSSAGTKIMSAFDLEPIKAKTTADFTGQPKPKIMETDTTSSTEVKSAETFVPKKLSKEEITNILGGYGFKKGDNGSYSVTLDDELLQKLKQYSPEGNSCKFNSFQKELTSLNQLDIYLMTKLGNVCDGKYVDLLTSDPLNLIAFYNEFKLAKNNSLYTYKKTTLDYLDKITPEQWDAVFQPLEIKASSKELGAAIEYKASEHKFNYALSALHNSSEGKITIEDIMSMDSADAQKILDKFGIKQSTIDEIQALSNYMNKLETKSPMQVYRGEGYEVLGKTMITDLDNNQISLADYLIQLSSKQPDEIEAAVKYLNNYLKVSDLTATQERFMSTSIIKGAEFNSAILWEFDLPAGTRGVYIESVNPSGALGHEVEYLIQNGSSIQITGIEYVHNPEHIWKIKANIIQK